MEKFLALSQEKQATIRNAALACFAKHGYEKASINDIAMAAGISKASMFQYFGSKRALYGYLFHYCSNQMKQAYDLRALDRNADFFDRVWQASVMKVENLKANPYVAAFITSAVGEQTPELREDISALMAEGERFVEALVLRSTDKIKFKYPEDASLVFQMLMLMGKGMALPVENDEKLDYSATMEGFKDILQALKRNFYREEYLS